MRLGTTYNNYDEEIIKYANKYGIPPQYLKGHVHQEAKKEKGNYIADSFRYEPLSWDIAGLSVTTWSDEKWTEKGSSKAAFEYPLGSGIQGVLSKVNSFCYGTITVPQGPLAIPIYNCTPYSEYPEDNSDEQPDNPKPVRVIDVYNFNNGWADGSYPNTLYGRTTTCPNPCVPRQNWDLKKFGVSLSFHNYQYYCGLSTAPATDCSKQQSLLDWLINSANSNVYAQIPVCSSYGLLQIMYFTATTTLNWMKDDNDLSHRRPELLTNVDTNLDLGCYQDTINMKHFNIENVTDKTTIENSLRNGFEAYNMGLSALVKKLDRGETPSYDYAIAVLGNAKNFMPLE